MAKLPGSVWISGNNIHFVDASGVEYYYTGALVSNIPTAIPGSIWMEGDSLHYIDASKNKRSLPGPSEGAVSALIGCIWVEGSRIKGVGGSGIKVNYHVDAHSDGGHNDHTDTGTPHIDAPAGHSDTHNDQHGDQPPHYNDQNIPVYCDAHYDVGGGATHQDGMFQCNGPAQSYGDYSPIEGGHGDAHVDFPFALHEDHSDGVHLDAHDDFHQDAFGAHADHTDHADHSDSSHVDVPHTDQPVLVGA